MKRIHAVIVIFIAVLTLCACNGLDKLQHKALEEAVSDVRESHKLLLPQYVKYVDADPKLDDGQKDDEKKFVESVKRLDESLKIAVENLKPKED